MKTYRDLEVWEKAVNMTIDIYGVTKTFPKEELYTLCSQMQRASISISANIAEGWGRGSRKEYLQFLKISRGSLLELETHLIISNRLNYIPKQKLDILLMKTQEVGRMLNGLINSISKKLTPDPRPLTPKP